MLNLIMYNPAYISPELVAKIIEDLSKAQIRFLIIEHHSLIARPLYVEKVDEQ